LSILRFHFRFLKLNIALALAFQNPRKLAYPESHGLSGHKHCWRNHPFAALQPFIEARQLWASSASAFAGCIRTSALFGFDGKWIRRKKQSFRRNRFRLAISDNRCIAAIDGLAMRH